MTAYRPLRSLHGNWKHVNGSQALEIDDVNAYDFALGASRKLSGSARHIHDRAAVCDQAPDKGHSSSRPSKQAAAWRR